MMIRRWVVRAGDGETVGAIVPRAAPGDAKAIAEGRVFIGRRRALAEADPVAVGDEVTVSTPPPVLTAPVLARGEGWVAMDKPAGLPTIPDQEGAAHALLYLAARSLSMDPARLHATSRLDRDVSGVVVFALDRDAAERIRRLREEHRYGRRYLAIAARPPEPLAGSWSVPIGRADNPRHRAANGRDAVEATTHYAVVDQAPPYALLALSPVTGRTHQLRVHASHAGAPLLGDRAYGGPSRATLSNGRVLAFDRIALHAARITLGDTVIESPVPEKLRALWLALGGDGAAWEKALACSLDQNK
ncbi:MAG: RluA family pseudouridine synthase [Polyangiaceae bacterium]